jgi:hypothetical protein
VVAAYFFWSTLSTAVSEQTVYKESISISITITLPVIINMSEALLSVLCGEDYWYRDPHEGCTIKFKKDGTDEVSSMSCLLSVFQMYVKNLQLLCAVELLMWIAVEFK